MESLLTFLVVVAVLANAPVVIAIAWIALRSSGARWSRFALFRGADQAPRGRVTLEVGERRQPGLLRR